MHSLTPLKGATRSELENYTVKQPWYYKFYHSIILAPTLKSSAGKVNEVFTHLAGASEMLPAWCRQTLLNKITAQNSAG